MLLALRMPGKQLHYTLLLVISVYAYHHYRRKVKIKNINSDDH